jgi:carbamoylphosphate synthase small subunit
MYHGEGLEMLDEKISHTEKLYLEKEEKRARMAFELLAIDYGIDKNKISQLFSKYYNKVIEEENSPKTVKCRNCDTCFVFQAYDQPFCPTCFICDYEEK